jgi:hypothetical protein
MLKSWWLVQSPHFRWIKMVYTERWTCCSHVDLIRGSEAITTKEGVIKESEESRSVGDFDVSSTPTGSRERAARDISRRMMCIVLACYFSKWASGNRSER